MKLFATRGLGTLGTWMVLVLVLAAAATPAASQKNKDKKKNSSKTDTQADFKSAMPVLPDPQAVDQTIGEALGYWQIGDVDSLHKYYSDDVVVVSGAYEPPVIGWDNFVVAYQAQRARVTGGRMDRSNTIIHVNGNTAWATYQFLYVATMGGRAVQSYGHTTLVLNKQGDRWVIVLNHSSVVDSAPSNPAPADSAQPGRP